MKTTYRYSKYPKTGFGSKSGQLYILDAMGRRYDFNCEFDDVLKEVLWTLDLPEGHFVGEDPEGIIEVFNESGVGSIKKW